MKLTQNLRTFATTVRATTLAITVVAGLGLLAGCATTQTASTSEPAVYKFTVFHYKEPVLVNNWTYDAAKNDGPEGAALNITALMQNGDVDQWLASWNESEKPALTSETRQSLQQSWKPLKDGKVFILNRIIADADVVIEISVVTADQKSEKVQIPLTHSQGQWKLTKLDAGSQFLNWQVSENKIVTECEPQPMSDYVTALAKSTPQARL